MSQGNADVASLGVGDGDGTDLRRTPNEPDIARGVTWSFVSLAGKQLVRIAFSLLLARLLGPRSYGIVGQATIYIMLTRFFLDQGFGTALVQKRRLEGRDVGTVVLMNMAAVAVLVILTMALAEPMAVFFDSPELAGVLRVLAIDVVLMGLAVVPTALLTRHLRFKSLALAEILSTVVGGSAAVAFALAGGEYWSLVLFTLVTDGVYLVIVLTRERPRHLRGSWQSLQSLWAFSLRVMGSQILYYVARNADNLFIAKSLGAVALGLYSLAYRILMLPQQMLGQVINRVTLPVFSRAQDDPQRVGRIFLDMTAALALLTFPGFVLVVVAAPELVPLAFGDGWTPAVRAMQILAVAGLVMAPAHLARPVLFAYGAPGTVLRVQSVATASAVVGFGIGVQWGIEGVALAVAIVNLAFGPLLLSLACKRIGLPVVRYLERLGPATAASGVVGVVYLGVVAAMGDQWDGVLLGSTLGAASYVTILHLVWPDDAAFAWGLCRRMLLGRRVRAGAELRSDLEAE